MLAHITVNGDPFLLRFPVGWPVEGIRWYGVFYVVSFFLVQFFLSRYSRRGISSLTREQNDSLLIFFALGAVIGGRLGYCLFYNFDHFIQNPLIFFQIWQGGMASHGGFIGAIVAILYFSKTNRQDCFRVADLLSATIPLCLGLGRIGNFINGELYGRITDVPWGMIFERVDAWNVRHPSQLYEAFFEGFLPFLVLQILIQKGVKSGILSGVFLILYALGRIFCECFRVPDAPLILSMTRGQFLSLFLLLLGIVLVIIRFQTKKISSISKC